MHFQFIRLPNEPTSGRFLDADGQHDSAIQPYVWLIPPVLSPYLNANEGIGLLETDLLDCWP